jgi:uncharacterized Zn finger protein (UPF0148 family)
MKVCGNCGEEIATKDGDNLCESCDNAESKKRLARNRRQAATQERESVMRSLGLTKVRGALGGTYWE